MHDSCDNFPVRLADVIFKLRYCSLVINVKVFSFGSIQVFEFILLESKRYLKEDCNRICLDMQINK